MGIFRAVFDTAPNAIVVFNGQGKVLMANRKVKSVFGYTNEELTEKTLDFFLQDGIVTFSRHYSSLPMIGGAEQLREIEINAKRKNGTIFLVAANLSPVLVEDELLVSATFRDITEEKRLYNELEMSNEQFKGAFEYSAIGMGLVSLEGKWLKVNKQVCQTLGYSEKELLSKTFQEITHPDDLDLDMMHVQGMLLGEIMTYQMEKRYIHKTGTIIWVTLSVSLVRDTNGIPMHFVSQIKDITERKEAEMLLKASDALLGKLSQQIPGVMYTFQMHPDGGFEYPFVSEGIMELFELSPEQVKQDPSILSRLIHPDDAQVLRDSVDFSYKNITFWEREYRVVLPTKGLRWMKASSKPEKMENGTVEWFGCIVDITHLKEKEAEQDQSLSIIGEQNKRLLNFAHIVSHNLRSHAGNFQTLLKFLEMEDMEPRARTLFEHLKGTSSALAETIKNLNEIVSAQTNLPIPKEKINLRNYIHKTTQVLCGEIDKKKASVQNHVPFDLLIDYNPAYMESILLNFLSNALKYAHPDREAVVKFMWQQENQKNYLVVADNGSGIDLDLYGHKLFGMHKTFHGNEDARGIGLFITKDQIEAMGGAIEVESKVNVGTTFKISIS